MSEPAPDAIINLTAELTGAMWSLYVMDGDQKRPLGSGTAGSSIMFPARWLTMYANRAEEREEIAAEERGVLHRE